MTMYILASPNLGYAKFVQRYEVGDMASNNTLVSLLEFVNLLPGTEDIQFAVSDGIYQTTGVLKVTVIGSVF